MKRRVFLQHVARGGLIGALGVLSGILLARRQVTLEESCTGQFQCRSCNRINRCELPEAKTARDYGEKG